MVNTIDTRDEKFMRAAINEAKKAALIGEVPIGAVICKGDEVIAAAHNRRETDRNALAHAEIPAIDIACRKLGGWRLHECELFVTLEPCAMCAGAIINARIKRVVFGAFDPKAGSFGSVVNLAELPYNHHPLIAGGILEADCGRLLTDFFAQLRKNKVSCCD